MASDGVHPIHLQCRKSKRTRRRRGRDRPRCPYRRCYQAAQDLLYRYICFDVYLCSAPEPLVCSLFLDLLELKVSFAMRSILYIQILDFNQILVRLEHNRNRHSLLKSIIRCSNVREYLPRAFYYFRVKHKVTEGTRTHGHRRSFCSWHGPSLFLRFIKLFFLFIEPYDRCVNR